MKPEKTMVAMTDAQYEKYTKLSKKASRLRTEVADCKREMDAIQEYRQKAWDSYNETLDSMINFKRSLEAVAKG